MLVRIKMKIYAEILRMRLCFCVSLFIVLCFFMSGFICASRLTDEARAAVSAFMLGSSAAVFPTYFALFWKRLVSLALCCCSGFYIALFPLCLCFLLFFELTFCLTWGCMLTNFWRAASILPFICLPMIVFLFCTTYSLACMFKGFSKQLKERRIPKTCSDVARESLDIVKAFLYSFSAICCAGAVEAIVAAIAL